MDIDGNVSGLAGGTLEMTALQAGRGTFYTGVMAGGGSGAYSTYKPDYGFVDNPARDAGLMWAPAGYPQMIAAGKTKMFWTGNYTAAFGKFKVTHGNAADPGLSLYYDANTGIFGPDTYGDGDIWAVATGGVEAFRLDADQQATFPNDVRAGHVEAGHGNFYTSLTCSDWEFWQADDGLVLTPPNPHRTYPTILDAALMIDGALDLSQNMASWDDDAIGAPFDVIRFQPEGVVTVGSGTWISLRVAPSLDYTNNVSIGSVVNFSGLQSSSHPALFASQITVFNCQATFQATEEGGKVPGASVYIAGPIFRCGSGLTNTMANFTGFENTMFKCSPAFTATGDGGDFHVDVSYGSRYNVMINSLHSNAASTLDLYTDVAFQASILSGTGTEELTERRYIDMADDTLAGTITGIKSVLSSGANKKFINHTGTAVSVFGGAITAPAFNLTTPQTYTTSNVSIDRSFDADGGDINVVSDVLATLIEDLKTAGILT
jgi:hypothetical protein